MAGADTTTGNPRAQPGSTIAPATTRQTLVRRPPGSDRPATARRPTTRPVAATMNCGRDQRPTVDVATAPIRPATGTARPVPGRSPPAVPGFPRSQLPRSQSRSPNSRSTLQPTGRSPPAFSPEASAIRAGRRPLLPDPPTVSRQPTAGSTTPRLPPASRRPRTGHSIPGPGWPGPIVARPRRDTPATPTTTRHSTTRTGDREPLPDANGRTTPATRGQWSRAQSTASRSSWPTSTPPARSDRPRPKVSTTHRAGPEPGHPQTLPPSATRHPLPGPPGGWPTGGSPEAGPPAGASTRIPRTAPSGRTACRWSKRPNCLQTTAGSPCSTAAESQRAGTHSEKWRPRTTPPASDEIAKQLTWEPVNKPETWGQAFNSE